MDFEEEDFVQFLDDEEMEQLELQKKQAESFENLEDEMEIYTDALSDPISHISEPSDADIFIKPIFGQSSMFDQIESDMNDANLDDGDDVDILDDSEFDAQLYLKKHSTVDDDELDDIVSDMDENDLDTLVSNLYDTDLEESLILDEMLNNLDKLNNMGKDDFDRVLNNPDEYGKYLDNLYTEAELDLINKKIHERYLDETEQELLEYNKQMDILIQNLEMIEGDLTSQDVSLKDLNSKDTSLKDLATQNFELEDDALDILNSQKLALDKLGTDDEVLDMFSAQNFILEDIESPETLFEKLDNSKELQVVNTESHELRTINKKSHELKTISHESHELKTIIHESHELRTINHESHDLKIISHENTLPTIKSDVEFSTIKSEKASNLMPDDVYLDQFDDEALDTFESYEPEFVIILYRNKGKGGSASVKVCLGHPMPKALAPSKEGHTFVGYFDTLNDGVQYYDGNMNSTRDWDKPKTSMLYARYE